MLEGLFSDASPGLACAGFVTAADTSVAPSYLWEDSGGVAEVEDSGDPEKSRLKASPRPGEEKEIDLKSSLKKFEVNGNPAIPPAEQATFSGQVTQNRARTQIQVFDFFAAPDSLFDITFDINVSAAPGQDFDTEVTRSGLFPDTPHGLSDSFPAGLIQVGLRELTLVDSFFNVNVQVGAVAIDTADNRIDLQFQSQNLFRKGSGNGARVSLAGGTLSELTPLQILAIEISIDFSAFASALPPSADLEIFTDGFESGDVSQWSRP